MPQGQVPDIFQLVNVIVSVIVSFLFTKLQRSFLIFEEFSLLTSLTHYTGAQPFIHRGLKIVTCVVNRSLRPHYRGQYRKPANFILLFLFFLLATLLKNALQFFLRRQGLFQQIPSVVPFQHSHLLPRHTSLLLVRELLQSG